MKARVTLMALCFLSASVSGQTPRKVSRDSTVVVLLGTGTPVPNPNAQGPATAVVYGKRLLLFDTGSGVERQLNKAQLPFANIEAVFLTHLHSDHILGLPDVIFTSWVFGRHSPLKLFGPSGTRNLSEHLIAAFAEDIKARTSGLEGAIPNGYRVDAREVSSGVVYDSGGVRVRAIPVPHITGRPALAYRIDTPDRSIVISGDTGPTDVLVSWSMGVDVLVHEVVNMSEIDGKFPGGGDMRPYMRTAHTPAPKLGEIAARAHPRVLVLTHIIGQNEKQMIAGVRSGGYKGRVVFGRDLDRF